MKKKCKVVAISSDKRSFILKNIHGYPLYIPLEGKINDSRCEWQHLYILSNEKIEIGDFYYHGKNQTIHKKMTNDYLNHFDDIWLQKIIATTDESLDLPKISNEDIQKYCKLKFSDVNVEYEAYGYDISMGGNLYQLKLNIKNEINISNSNEKYNKNDLLCLIELWKESQKFDNLEYGKILPQTFDEWLIENI